MHASVSNGQGAVVYGADYYERGPQTGQSLYQSYHWLPEQTCAMAMALVDGLPIRPDDTVLDYGCAKGYLVKALRILRRRAWGVDCSPYAIATGDESAWPYLFQGDGPIRCPAAERWDWIVCKDVLEHIADPDALLRSKRPLTRGMFVAVPLGDGERYVIPDYEADATHCIRWDRRRWEFAFEQAGFRVVRFGYRFPGVKDRWVRKYPRGNGFWVLA